MALFLGYGRLLTWALLICGRFGATVVGSETGRSGDGAELKTVRPIGPKATKQAEAEAHDESVFGGVVVAERIAADFLAALDSSATWIVNGGNITYQGTGHHYSNALLTKLASYDSLGLPEDLQGAQVLLQYVLEHNTMDLSFGGLFASPLLTGSLGRHLREEDLEALRGALYALLPEATPGEPADVCYTNMFLMNTANLILLGEALDDEGPNAATARAAGMAQWAHWLNYTRNVGGLHEFDSPTYTGVQTVPLYLLHLYAADRSVAKDAGQALGLIWHGVAGSWFRGGHMLGGPHSRDYDALFGKGLLNGQLSLVPGFTSRNEAQDELYQCEFKDVHCEAVVCAAGMGLSEADLANCRGGGQQAIYAYLNFVYAPQRVQRGGGRGGRPERPFRMPPSVSALASRTGPIEVEKRWQEGPAGDYHFYREEAFGLGVISDDYDTNLHGDYVPYPPNAQDKVLSLALRNSLSQENPLPALSLAPDWRDFGVYGKQVWGPAGKPVHLRMRPTAVQHQGTAVILLALDPQLNETSGMSPAPGNATRLSLNQILPLPQEFGPFAPKLILDGASVALPQDPATAPTFATVAKPLPEVGILQGGAAVATRVFLADTCGGGSQGSGTVASLLRGDDGDIGGLQYHALRLETVLYDGDEDVRSACKDTHLVRVGIIVAAKTVHGPDTAEEDLAALQAELGAVQPNSKMEGSLWSVDLTVRGSHFELARDLSGWSEANQGAIFWRRLNGFNVSPPDYPGSIVVNGDVVAEL